MRSMVAYGSFLDATRDLPAEDFKEVWVAILEYGIDEIEPESLSPVAKMAFLLAKPNIDSNKKRRKQKDGDDIDAIADSKDTSADKCEQLQTIVSTNAHSSIDGDGDGDVDVDEDFNGDVNVDVESIKTSCGKRSNNRPPLEPEADTAAIPLNDGSAWRPPLSLYETYEQSYPAVDLPQEFNKMRSWVLSNPKNCKTKNGVKRFVNSWLGKAQDRAAKQPTGRASPYQHSNSDVLLSIINGGA